MPIHPRSAAIVVTHPHKSDILREISRQDVRDLLQIEVDVTGRPLMVDDTPETLVGRYWFRTVASQDLVPAFDLRVQLGTHVSRIEAAEALRRVVDLLETQTEHLTYDGAFIDATDIEAELQRRAGTHNSEAEDEQRENDPPVN